MHNTELEYFLREHELTIADLARSLERDRKSISRWGTKKRLTRFQRLALRGLVDESMHSNNGMTNATLMDGGERSGAAFSD